MRTFNLEKYLKLKSEIERICRGIGRNIADISILAATKYADIGAIKVAIDSGIGLIGENKIQDAQKKFTVLNNVKRHFIGHLQSNKAKLAVKLFDLIESVDSLKLAESINLEAEKQHKIMPILLEVNIADDAAKFGFSFDEFGQNIDKIVELKNLSLRGLMTIVPFFENPADARPYFKKMKKLFDSHNDYFNKPGILSMGMSNDFMVAVEEGSTEIRIGSYFFSDRACLKRFWCS